MDELPRDELHKRWNLHLSLEHRRWQEHFAAHPRDQPSMYRDLLAVEAAVTQSAVDANTVRDLRILWEWSQANESAATAWANGTDCNSRELSEHEYWTHELVYYSLDSLILAIANQFSTSVDLELLGDSGTEHLVWRQLTVAVMAAGVAAGETWLGYRATDEWLAELACSRSTFNDTLRNELIPSGLAKRDQARRKVNLTQTAFDRLKK